MLFSVSEMSEECLWVIGTWHNSMEISFKLNVMFDSNCEGFNSVEMLLLRQTKTSSIVLIEIDNFITSNWMKSTKNDKCCWPRRWKKTALSLNESFFCEPLKSTQMSDFYFVYCVGALEKILIQLYTYEAICWRQQLLQNRKTENVVSISMTLMLCHFVTLIFLLLSVPAKRNAILSPSR